MRPHFVSVMPKRVDSAASCGPVSSQLSDEFSAKLRKIFLEFYEGTQGRS
jgi:hypothetical protein